MIWALAIKILKWLVTHLRSSHLVIFLAFRTLSECNRGELSADILLLVTTYRNFRNQFTWCQITQKRRRTFQTLGEFSRYFTRREAVGNVLMFISGALAAYSTHGGPQNGVGEGYEIDDVYVNLRSASISMRKTLKTNRTNPIS